MITNKHPFPNRRGGRLCPPPDGQSVPNRGRTETSTPTVIMLLFIVSLAIPLLAISQEKGNPALLLPSHGASIADKEAQTEYDKGMECYQEFRFSQATEHFQKAVAKAAEPAYYLALGNSQYQQDRFEDAAKSLESAAKLAQRKGNQKIEGDALNSLGLTYKTLGKYDEAVGCYKRSLKIRQGLGDLEGESASKYNLACVYVEQGKQDEAVDLMKEVGKTQQMLKMLDKSNLVPLDRVFHCAGQSRSY